MKLNNSIKNKIKKLEKSSITAHKTGIELKNYFIEKNIPEDILTDNLISLKCGDISSEDFIEFIENIETQLSEKDSCFESFCNFIDKLIEEENKKEVIK